MPLARLEGDLLALVLLNCDLETLCAVIACATEVSKAARTMIRSSRWRAQPCNENALSLAAWEHGPIFEAVMGGFRLW